MRKIARTSLFVALTVTTLAPLGAVARQGVFDMGTLTNTLSQDAGSGVGGSKSSGKAKVRRKVATPAEVQRATTFTPSLAVRKRNNENFVKSFAKTQPEAAKAWRDLFAQGDVIASLAPEFKKYGLKTNSLSDAISAYLVTGWHGARGSTDATKAQYLAVARQFGQVIATNPKFKSTSATVKQETSETLILSSVVLDAKVKAAKGNPKLMAEAKAAVAKDVRQSFGLDVTAINLGANGLTAK